jgi:hypothetical protein
MQNDRADQLTLLMAGGSIRACVAAMSFVADRMWDRLVSAAPIGLIGILK